MISRQKKHCTNDTYYALDKSNLEEKKCVNCNHVNNMEPETNLFGVHQLCSNCHEFIDVDVSKKIKIPCRHCFYANYFDDGEESHTCKKCGKRFDEEVEKGRKATFEFHIFKDVQSGAITRTYL